MAGCSSLPLGLISPGRSLKYQESKPELQSGPDSALEKAVRAAFNLPRGIDPGSSRTVELSSNTDALIQISRYGHSCRLKAIINHIMA